MSGAADRTRLTVACAQLCSTTEPARNLALASDLVREAAGRGAQLVGLPEVVNLMQVNRKEAVAAARTEDEDESLAGFRALAEELGIWLHVGSLSLKIAGEERLANRGLLIDPKGAIRGRYDKIHMFDVDLEGGESYRESNGYRPGGHAELVETPWGGYGMSVCYDVRFPHLYRDLAKAGARMLAVPAAFTRKTGRAHWHVLLRARAIENGCFVLAPAQTGVHEDGRETYGHALIVAPWGEVLDDAGEEPGLAVAEIDLSEVDRVRSMVPSLSNDRPYDAPRRLGLAAE
ncbi:MAG: carbon-nitrogen hydrolase family protein [Alphaproteobacteria bacterium]|nr:carbon-nitrogen hydrolase family protein [Alphaproteobacteria bacterium]